MGGGTFILWVFGDGHVGTDPRLGRARIGATIRRAELVCCPTSTSCWVVKPTE